MEDTLRERRNEILFEDHLNGIGEGLEQPEGAEAEHGSPVGPDAILDDGALLSLDPGQEEGKKHGPSQGQDDLDEDDESFRHDIIRE